ncbi:MAG TPA: sulfotransferase [Rhizomicrobium sp.]|nr:sulfotransferase [Rhizomicrobium sp.]
MKSLWVHIGLAKTATTTLQGMLFSRHPEIGYLGKNRVPNERAREALIRFTRTPESKFDFEDTRSVFYELIQQHERMESQKRILLLSEEDLTTFRFIDPGFCASRLRRMFPDARILLVIREPMEWLQSMYFFRLSLRFPETLDGFNAWLKNGLERRFVRTDIGQIQIGTLLDYYVDCFSAEKITVLRYEDLVSDGRQFIISLSELLGVDPQIALALFYAEGGAPFRKLRVTEKQKMFFEKYKLVIQGRYLEYMDELRPLMATLGGAQRRRAMEMIPTDLNGDRTVIETELKNVSAFLDRACQTEFLESRSASAEADPDLKERVIEIWKPGARVIASRFNSSVNAYFAEPVSAS